MGEQETEFIKSKIDSKNRLHKVKLILKILNIVLFLIFTLIFILFEIDFLPRAKTGFFCNDPSIKKPFKGDTVTDKCLVSILLFVPLIALLLVELISAKNLSWMSFKNTHRPKILSLYGEYFLGAYCVLCITYTFKYTLSEPRPHFIDTCKPNVNCTNNGILYYVSEFNCTGPGSRRFIAESTKSFPSGHASMSIYLGCFIIWYIHVRLSNFRLFLLPLLLQGITVCLSVFVALSRMYDHRHHWWDVLFGGVIGVAFFMYQVSILSKKLHKTQRKDLIKSQIQEMMVIE